MAVTSFPWWEIEITRPDGTSMLTHIDDGFVAQGEILDTDESIMADAAIRLYQKLKALRDA